MNMQSRYKKSRKSAVHFSPNEVGANDDLSNLEINARERANQSPPKTAQGKSRTRDFNRFSHFNPTNDR